MKVLFYIMIALCMSTTFTSCTPTQMAEQVETVATEGDDGHVEEEDEGGN